MPTAYRRAIVEAKTKPSLLLNTLCFIGVTQQGCLFAVRGQSRLYTRGAWSTTLPSKKPCSRISNRHYAKPMRFILGIEFIWFLFITPIFLRKAMHSASVASGKMYLGKLNYRRLQKLQKGPKRSDLALLHHARKKDLEEKPFCSFCNRVFHSF